MEANVTTEEVPDKDDKKIFRKSQIDKYRKRKATYQENKGKIYLVIIGQCTYAMIRKLKGDSNFDLIEHNSDMMRLLGMIKKLAFKEETQQYLFQSLHVALRRFYTTYQRDGTTMEQYYVHFMNQRNVVEHYGGNLGDHKGLMKHCLDKKPAGTTDAETALNKREAKKESKEAYMAIAFISGASRIKYGRLIEELENSYLKVTKTSTRRQ